MSERTTYEYIEAVKEIGKLKEQIDSQRQRIAELEQNLRRTEAGRNGLLNDRDAMVERSAELEAEIARRENMFAQALRIIDDRKLLNDRHVSRIAEMGACNAALRTEVARLQRMLDSMVQLNAENAAHYDRVRSGLDALLTITVAKERPR